jgi:hypothetical protein
MTVGIRVDEYSKGKPSFSHDENIDSFHDEAKLSSSAFADRSPVTICYTVVTV